MTKNLFRPFDYAQGDNYAQNDNYAQGDNYTQDDRNAPLRTKAKGTTSQPECDCQKQSVMLRTLWHSKSFCAIAENDFSKVSYH